MPQVSVVIPAYNSELFLKQTINSVLAQTFTGWELLVVDDGSKDGTASLVQEYAGRDGRIRLLQQENSGVAGALNHGFACISPDSIYLSILGHDDIWKPDMLQTLIAAVERAPLCVGAYGNAQYIDSKGDKFKSGEFEKFHSGRREIVNKRVVLSYLDKPTNFKMLACFNCIPASGVVVRRAIMDRVNLFDPKCVGAEDWDLWLRMSLLGDFCFVDQVVYSYRIHETNMSKNREFMMKAEHTMLSNLINSNLLTTSQKQALRIGYKYRQWTEIVKLRSKWARESFARRQFLNAAKQICHLLFDYIRVHRKF